MPITYTVPESVRKLAEQTLRLHKADETKPEGVQGISVAEALSGGSVGFDTVSKMRRFFAVSERAYLQETQLLRTEHDSAIIRSWCMYGAEAGRAWAERQYKKGVEEGEEESDPVTDLFSLRPEEIYPRFSANAWRFEYDLDPTKAARFVEYYQRATGFTLDLPQAFGNAAPAVGNAIYRRYHTPNPFRQIYKAMMVEDTEYRFAAACDLHEVSMSTTKADMFFESPSLKQLTTKAIATYKLLWPVFVSYFVLAVEDPQKLKGVNASSLKPPVPNADKFNPMAQNDAINIYAPYFTLTGITLGDGTAKSPAQVKGFETLTDDLFGLMTFAHYGKPLQRNAVIKVLLQARDWASKHKQGGQAFHVMIQNWKKGNWQGILDEIPVDSDMYLPFKEFVASKTAPEGDVMPKDGMELAQTPMTKRERQEVNDYLETQTFGPFKAVPIDTTSFGELAKSKGKPIGIHSMLVTSGGIKAEVLGAFENPKGDTYFLLKHMSGAHTGQIDIYDSDYLVQMTDTNQLGFVKPHKDLPTEYNNAPELEKKGQTSGQGNSEVIQYMQTEFEDNFALFTSIPLDYTIAATALEEEYGVKLTSGMVLTHFVKGWKFEILAAFKSSEGNLIVYRDDDGEIGSEDDDAVATYIGEYKVGPENVKKKEAKPKVPSGIDDALLAYLDEEGLDPDTIKEVPLEKTLLYKKATADGHAAGSGSWWQYGSKTLTLRSAWTDADNLTYIVWNVKGTQTFYSDLDKGAAASYDMNALYPIPKQDEVAAKPAYVPKYHAGDIVEWGGHGNYHILYYEAGVYIVIWLNTKSSSPTGVPAEDFDKMSKPHLYSADFAGVANAMTIGEAWSFSETPVPWGVSMGKTVKLGNKRMKFAFALKAKSEADSVMLAEIVESKVGSIDVSYYKFTIHDAADVFGKVVESSYNPPEGDEGESHTDPDKMSGTKDAFDFMSKKGWTPTTQEQSGGVFKWSLGDVLAYGKATRTIVGYAYDPDMAQYMYVTLTEKSNMSYKTASTGNNQYGPKTGVSQEVIESLLPPPGTEKAPIAPEFPKLNYKLGTTAKEIAKKENLLYVPYEGGHPQPVGSYLTAAGGSGKKHRFLAYTTEKTTGDVLAVLYNKDENKVIYVMPEALKNNWTLWYETDSKVDMDTGEIVFGKKDKFGGGPVLWIDGMTPISPGSELIGDDDDFLNPISVMQPPFDTLPSGKHVSAGIVCVVDNYKVSVTQGTLTPAGVVMFHPTGEYGGYKLTFPKGTVDKDEAIEKAAVREVWEETGLCAKPVKFLGDYKGGDSLTRFFIGYITGGNPYKAGKECDAVTIKPLVANPEVFPWWSDLKERDQKIYQDTWAWYNTNGAPSGNTVDAADYASAVCEVPDVTEVLKSLQKFNPDAKYEQVGNAKEKKKSGTTDYPTLPEADKYIADMVSDMDEVEGYAWIGYWKNVMPFEFPPPGSKYLYADDKTPYTALGYVRIDGVEPNHEQDVYLVFRDEDGEIDTHQVLTAPNPTAALTPVDSASNFTPAIQKDLEGVTVPATDVGDPWQTLLYKSPFPITKLTLTKLAKTAQTHGVPYPESFALKTSPAPGIQVGDFVKYIPGTSLMYGGTVTATQGPASVTAHILLNTQGGVTLLTEAPSAWDKDPDATFANAQPAAPWFAHKDAKVMKVMAAVFTSGGDLKKVGITLAQFKQWCNQSNLPNAGMITTDIVSSVASLFIAGLRTKLYRDAVLTVLSSRAELSMKASKPVAPAKVSGPEEQTAVKPDMFTLETPEIKVAASGLDSATVKFQTDNPNPAMFKSTGAKVSGGSKPNQLLDGPAGLKWFFKTGNTASEAFRAHIDQAAYKLSDAIKGNAIPVGVMEFEGQVGSFQPFASDAESVPSDPSALSEDNMAELLAQHMADMFFGDHDGHAGNWIKLKNGTIRAIDRGQAFKFMFQGTPDSYDPTYQASGNFGSGYAKQLLIQWSKSKVTIPDKAFKAMRKAIAKIQALPDALLDSTLAPVFEAKKSSASEQKKVLGSLKKRRDSFLKDWTDVMSDLAKKRGESFDWPSVGHVAAPVASFTSSPADLNYGKVEEETIQQAVASGWQGKSMRIDKDAIEEQNVMVRKVTLATDKTKVPGTLVHFRVAHHVGPDAVKKLLIDAKVVESVDQRLKVDIQKNYYDKIQAAIKTIYYHTVDKKDLQVNEGSIKAAYDIVPELEKIQAETADQEGTYKPTNEPNAQVHTMAGLYLDYIAVIKWNHNKVKEHVQNGGDASTYEGEKGAFLSPFYPKGDEGRREEAPKTYTVKFYAKGGTWPEASASMGDITINAFEKQMLSSGPQPQFVIEDKTTKTRLHFSPPAGTGIAGVNEGMSGHRGIVWGVIPGEPSPQTVAHLMKLFKDATGVDTTPAAKKDNEALYWSKQVYLLQEGGAFKPETYGVGVVEKGFAAAMDKYRAGDPDGAIKDMQQIVAKKLGKSVAEVKELADPEGEYTRGAGWHRHTRIGWTRDKMKALFKDGSAYYFPCHKLIGNDSVTFMQQAMKNGALISTDTKPYYGIPINGGSPGADVNSGGSQGLFGAFRRAFTAHDDVLYLDWSILLRTDVYVVGTGDAFGNIETQRITDPEKWRKWCSSSNATGGISCGSSYQINYRHDIDIQQYVYVWVCAGKTSRDKVREMCKQVGWTTFADGRTLEQVVVTQAEAQV